MKVFPFGPQVPPIPSGSAETAAVTVGDLTDIELIAQDKVLQWRAKILAENGFNPHQARALALNRDVDVRWVVNKLVKRGCDTDTAFDIAS